jgi:CBS domain containing-hemolysin-like protein
MSSISTSWIWIGIVICVIKSALFSGLNLAVFSLSPLRLQIEADNGNADALGVLKLRQDANHVLSTVIWGNVSINVMLTLLSSSVLAGLLANANRPLARTGLWPLGGAHSRACAHILR